MSIPIEHEIVIDAPVDVVWRTVTEPEQVSQWFADEVDLVPDVGYDGVLTFGDRATAEPMVVQVSVQSVEPSRTFAYRWQHPQGATAGEHNSVLVTFTLTPDGAGTLLRVVETGVEQMGWPPPEQDGYVRDHVEGWAIHFDRLREHLSRQRVDRAR